MKRGGGALIEAGEEWSAGSKAEGGGRKIEAGKGPGEGCGEKEKLKGEGGGSAGQSRRKRWRAAVVSVLGIARMIEALMYERWRTPNLSDSEIPILHQLTSDLENPGSNPSSPFPSSCSFFSSFLFPRFSFFPLSVPPFPLSFRRGGRRD